MFIVLDYTRDRNILSWVAGLDCWTDGYMGWIYGLDIWVDGLLGLRKNPISPYIHKSIYPI